MSMSFDVANDWQGETEESLGLPHGWSAPPPDSFQPAGDEAGEVQMQKGQGPKASQGAKKPHRKPQKGGKQKNRAATSADAGIAADAPATKTSDGESRGGGRAAARPQSASGASRGRRSGGDKPAKGQLQAPAEAAAGGSGAAVTSAAPKDKAPDVASSAAGAGGSGGGGKSARSRGRGGGKVVVPANIRLAAEDVVKARDGAPPAAAP